MRRYGFVGVSTRPFRPCKFLCVLICPYAPLWIFIGLYGPYRSYSSLSVRMDRAYAT